jgi:hypothetical protein
LDVINNGTEPIDTITRHIALRCDGLSIVDVCPERQDSQETVDLPPGRLQTIKVLAFDAKFSTAMDQIVTNAPSGVSFPLPIAFSIDAETPSLRTVSTDEFRDVVHFCHRCPPQLCLGADPPFP